MRCRGLGLGGWTEADRRCGWGGTKTWITSLKKDTPLGTDAHSAILLFFFYCAYSLFLLPWAPRSVCSTRGHLRAAVSHGVHGSRALSTGMLITIPTYAILVALVGEGNCRVTSGAMWLDKYRTGGLDPVPYAVRPWWTHMYWAKLREVPRAGADSSYLGHHLVRMVQRRPQRGGTLKGSNTLSASRGGVASPDALGEAPTVGPPPGLGSALEAARVPPVTPVRRFCELL